MLTITVNGKEYPLEGCENLAELLDKLSITPQKMAVELNFEIIPHHALATTKIKAGDQIEIIQFVGGG
ncbi:MAG: sulfur carrier protein ThiS [Kiritimatiellae bacterium]|nr:sulfur carrier protein ThiS [Kiritimatiellia bacterium]